MSKINVNKLTTKHTIVLNGVEHKVTSIKWDKENQRVTILGTNGLAESVRENTKINIK